MESQEQSQEVTEAANDEYMTVSEFATAAGVTAQAVYKRLNTTLNPYIKRLNGKKLINKRALTLYKPEVEQPIQPDSTNVEQPIQPTLHNRCQPLPTPEKVPEEETSEVIKTLQSIIETLQHTNGTLEEQLKVKDEQLRAQADHIKSQDETLRVLSENNIKLLDTVNQAQALHAGTIQTELLKGPEAEDPEPIQAEPSQKAKRRGILSRLLRKG